MRMLDLFAGPGGVDVGARSLGLNPLGIEFDADACATREAAGLRTVQADVAQLDPQDYPTDILWASPPCQAFSNAGGRSGIADFDELLRGLALRARGEPWEANVADERSRLIVEPMRWIVALRPPYIALEQVPPALPIYRAYAGHLRERVYHTWTGILNAADYGVPQIRKRAFLIASLSGAVAPPVRTHARHASFFGEKPWVTMAEALGWEPGEKVRTRGQMDPKKGGNLYPTERPSPTVVETTRSWEKEPARTICGHRLPRWCYDRPATTVVGSYSPEVIAGPGWRLGKHHRQTVDSEPAPTGRSAQSGIKVTLAEAYILQGMPPDYPFQGTKTSRFRQLGTLVPPALAAAVLSSLTAELGQKVTA